MLYALTLAAAMPAAALGDGFDFHRDINPGAEAAPPAASSPPQQTRRGRLGPALPNAHEPRGPYGWNDGIVWGPAPIYWAGGFWGPIPPAGPSEMTPIDIDSPGARLLDDYGLTQTPCLTSSGLVEIWGPSGSVICAGGNASVAAGNYTVDTAAFTLVTFRPAP